MAKTLTAPVRRILLESLLVGVLALVAAVPLLRLWEADLDVPFADEGDAKFYAALTKTLDEHGWYLENPDLGYPFGSQLYDLPIGGENLQIAALKALTLTGGWARAFNLYYLLGFPLVAVAAFHVARRFARLSGGVALVVALLYAFLPYHVARGEIHPLLSNYAVVPVACALVLALASRWDTWPVTRSELTLAVGGCVLVGVSSTYYGIFTGLLLVGVGAVVGAARREWRWTALAAALAGVIAAVLVLDLLPSLLYWLHHGTNSLTNRDARSSEIFGLKFAQLVLPVDGHRIGSLAALAARARHETIAPSEMGGALGIVGTGGFGVAVVAALTSGVRRDPEREERDPTRPALLGVVILIALLVALIGGLAFVFALTGFRYVRGWNRMSVFIAFLALLSVGHLLEALCARLRARGHRPRVGAALLASVAVIGLLDQVPATPAPYGDVARRFRENGRFVEAIEERLGTGASVFQLPAVPYPEAGPVQNMDDYDHFRGYLHSDDLRWSYGATKGREGKWFDALDPLPPLALVTGLAAAGFDGLWVDRAGFVDHAEAFESAIAPHVGDLFESRERQKRFAFADLGPFAARVRETLGPETTAGLREAIVHPIHERWADGFLSEDVVKGRAALWVARRAEIVVTNPGTTPRRALLRFDLTRSPAPVTVSWDGGSTVVPPAPRRETRPVSIAVDVPGGRSVVRLTTEAPASVRLADGARAAFRIVDFDLVESVIPRSAGRMTTSAGEATTRGSASSPS